MLSFKSFEKSYSGNTILQIDNFILDKGIYWLKGINGSGKSTLIKSIAGLISFKGNIFLKNTSLKKSPTIFKSKINFADAEPIFPEFLTGYEMLRLFIDAKKGSEEQIKDFISNMNMQHYLQNPVGSYSSGMLKKLSLLLALIGKPEWILFDEPFITLDQESLLIMQQYINCLYREKNINILFSSHQVEILAFLTDVRELIIEDKTIRITS